MVRFDAVELAPESGLESFQGSVVETLRLDQEVTLFDEDTLNAAVILTEVTVSKRLLIQN